jgi:hypothetical protein
VNDIATFLLARIQEDEADAWLAMKGFPSGEWTHDGGVYVEHPTREVADWFYNDTAAHVARWDPARVLAESRSKSRIIGQCRAMIATGERAGGGADQYAHGILRLLASPYAEHAEYREEWRPS